MSRYAVTEVAPWRFERRALSSPRISGTCAKRGRRRAERLVEEDLPRRVGEMVVAADDVRDPHVDVVDDDAEVVDRRCRRCAAMTKSSSSAFWKTTRPFTRSSTTVSPSSGVRKRSDERSCGRRRRGAVAAACGRSRRARRRRAPPAARLELLGRAPAAVGEAARASSVWPGRGRASVRCALEEGALVPVEAEPAEAVEDGRDRLGRRALAVGVLDAQDERAAVVAREEVVEERGARRRRCAETRSGSGRSACGPTSGADLIRDAASASQILDALMQHAMV